MTNTAMRRDETPSQPSLTSPGADGAAGPVLRWGSTRLTFFFLLEPADVPRLLSVGPPEDTCEEALARRASALPVVEIAVAGDGRHGTAGKRHVDGAMSRRLRLERSVPDSRDGLRRLRLDLRDPLTGTTVAVHYEIADDAHVVRTWCELTAGSELALEYISSLALGGLGHGRAWEEDLVLWSAANPWSGEFRWRGATLAELGLYDVGMVAFGQVGSKNRITVGSVGAWSTSERLPLGILEDRVSGRLTAWQVEHNGAWHWELADRYGDVYLAASGPTAQEHGFAQVLAAGESFTTVPAALAVVDGAPGGQEDALGDAAAALTMYRRRVRRPHRDHRELPVVYNDFLNALMSDPTTERSLPLIGAAAALGAEVYCIDAGWYDDENGGWWDSVGAWEPSADRFPKGGLGGLIQRIRDAGMRPGLWLEPEVVGVRSRIARSLPPEAFFQRNGCRVQEWGRYQLDLRHPAARAHLDGVLDRLMADFDLAYLKLDYNIDIGAGTEVGGIAVGRGLLEHNRSFLAWARAVMDRHPGLTLEACAAGGSRSDNATSAVFPLQSLTDQQDMRLMPPIIAASALSLPPEQAGVWASLDGTMDDETLAAALMGALLFRVHLAGMVSTLDERQRGLVRAGLAIYRDLRLHIPDTTPLWPLGLPAWRDGWVVYGARTGTDLWLAVWRRDTRDDRVEIPLPHGAGEARVLYPALGGEELERTTSGALALTMPRCHSARLLHLPLRPRES